MHSKSSAIRPHVKVDVFLTGSSTVLIIAIPLRDEVEVKGSLSVLVWIDKLIVQRCDLGETKR